MTTWFAKKERIECYTKDSVFPGYCTKAVFLVPKTADAVQEQSKNNETINGVTGRSYRFFHVKGNLFPFT